jgi:hypothetical protein
MRKVRKENIDETMAPWGLKHILHDGHCLLATSTTLRSKIFDLLIGLSLLICHEAPK